ncbi:RNA processing protein [Dimargaris verticillata]|uniref:LSM complex subunit LSM4 n=1 Tax=Dimargaris verticillata TaxID=2761393 RepID=A0A9W8B7T5_9FUNG|nr:RNA processing protein [Dimargaris verticillata]
MLPLSLMNTAKGRPIQVELKNGETYNGHLMQCDNFMNLTLREVIQTSADGEKFWRLSECYIRGNTVKYLQMPPEILDLVKEERFQHRSGRGGRGGQRGGRGRGGQRGTWGGRGLTLN